MSDDSIDRQRERARRLRVLISDPVMVLAVGGIYVSFGLLVFPSLLEGILTPRILALIVAAFSILIMMSKYLGITTNEQTIKAEFRRTPSESVDPSLLREIRNYLAHAPSRGDSPPTQINIDEEFKGQLLARLTTESQSALSSFIESEIFNKTAESRFKEAERAHIIADINEMISTYQTEMTSWRKNANLNLLIGLVCAVAGIGVMWQTLVTLNLEAGTAWNVSDLYHFISRFGLVVIIESVAFFFLKLYREDRSMIRYLRNEITNLESKCLSLKTALSFGTAADLTKILQSLAATERNFLVKKGERVMSDIVYENSEIMLEKIISRSPELLAKLTKTDS